MDCCLRTVHSRDGTTADVVRLPWELLERVSTRIINEIGINRAYDVINYTIEWEYREGLNKVVHFFKRTMMFREDL